MVSKLHFKGDKKTKKRKRAHSPKPDAGERALVESKPVELDDETWVTMESHEELSGPMLFTLNASTPVAISCDPTGKVFLSPLTQIESEDLNTSEPSDVQQVWIVHRLHGSEKFSIKSHHGKYLGVDKFGVLSATREAISPEEEWIPIRAEMNTGWAWQGCRDTFIGVNEVGTKMEVRGDVESIGFKETWVMRGQNRFKKKARKANTEEKKPRISSKELREMAGVDLTDEQIRTLKRAKRDGNLNEALLDVRVKHGKHDKFAY